MEKKGIKILVLIIILALLGGIIYFLVTKDGTRTPKTDKEIVTENTLRYFNSLSEGYDTEYNGKDRLFAQDEFTKGDLNVGMKLTTAFNYVLDPTNGMDNNITPQEYADANLGNDEVLLVKGKNVRDAIKILFGEEFENQGYENTNFKYTYYYLNTIDLYARAEKTNLTNINCRVLTKIMSTKKSDSTITTTLVVGYGIKNNNEYEIYSDATRKDLVKKVKRFDLEDLDEKELNKLSKYKITTKENNDNYTFEKIEAVK